MKGVAKNKVVTSGRMTGRGKTQPTQKQLIPNPRLAAIPEPAYSLYSSVSQDQVTFLHKGLDRCAALLGGILQADESDLPGDLGEAKESAVKSKLGKKFAKKAPAAPHRPAGTTLRTRQHPKVPAAHSGVKLHPTQKRFQTELLQLQTPRHTPSTSPHHTPSNPASHSKVVGKSGAESKNMSFWEQGACGGDDLIPVRDIDPQIASLKVSKMQQKRKLAEKVNKSHSPDDRSAEGDEKMQTFQYLLRELKALMIGEGSVAELLLRHLEQMVSSSLVSNQGESEASFLQNQNYQLRRYVEMLQQQLKLREKAKDGTVERLSHSEASEMQQELNTALSQLRELQDNLSELQKAHQVTQNQLRDKETINALIMSELEAARRQLLVSDREKSELATLCDQRLEELEHLKGVPPSPSASDCTLVDSTVANSQHRHDPELSEGASERITRYLMSLNQAKSTVNDGPQLNSQTTGPPDRQPAEHSGCHNPHLSWGPDMDKDPPRRRMSLALSLCDAESVLSAGSTKSGSTFNTMDHAAFKDGLSALDSSIANLLKTIELDRGRSCI
ncbi:uncharacterized protein isoform X2 [Takifugu rubripes]|uniref:uncharacterized protein isoform X2 n=1 Tax=Takifugu rubripes TaxID=31033 RepID=UPI00114575D1|nr:uncharacterized protein LOC105416745 isoform X2 [Takifugu rubripes]